MKALSGGERNRLLLARLFTRPANVLVLDEPTNDLDLETLELLEAELVEWPGTLLLVSHDRAFLDNVVTSTFVFEGDGRVREYVGGYEDWVRQRPSLAPPPAAAKPVGASGSGTSAPAKIATPAPAQQVVKKLSYRERRELDELPARIEKLEAEQHELAASVADSLFYTRGADVIRTTLAKLEEVQAELVKTLARWDALDSRTTRSSPAPSSTSRLR